MSHRVLILLVIVGFAVPAADAADWARFRGPNGSGVSADDVAPPTSWSDKENLKWKAELPGPGLSSPIVIGDRVVVTCWSGYAVDADDPGEIDNLKRNVICLDRATGNKIWSHVEDPVLPEDQYRGMFAQNGYASHSPATDGERVYVFFGKTGVIAFDLGDGRRLWQKSVGTNRERRGWGSASSPIVYKDTVIVPAFIESDKLVAFDGKSGDVKWEQEAPGYTSNWSTPILVEANDRTDLVMAVPGEVWGMNPESGKLRWYCQVPGSDSARASVISKGDVVIAMAGGRGASTSVAIKSGGKGEVKPIWTGRDVSSTASPVAHGKTMYVVNNKVATSVDLETGKRLSQSRLTGGSSSGGRDASRSGGRQGGGGPGGGRQGGGRGGYGGIGGQDYSSPVVAGNHLFYTSRNGEVYVFEVGDELKQIAKNSFESDRSDYSATPAISNGEIFIRSSKAVYCVAKSR